MSTKRQKKTTGTPQLSLTGNTTARPLSAQASTPSQESGMAHKQVVSLDPQQTHALLAKSHPLFIRGASGTGKTTLIAERALHLFEEGIAPQQILIITPTRQGAFQIDALIRAKQGKSALLPQTDTLAALALDLWHKIHNEVPVLLAPQRAKALFCSTNSDLPHEARLQAWEAFETSRKNGTPPPLQLMPFINNYSQHKQAWNLVDQQDLMEFWINEMPPSKRARPWSQILVEDAHRYTAQELQCISLLLPASGEGFFAVGDTSQSPFPGTTWHPAPEDWFRACWPNLHMHSLFCNYRSTTALVNVLNALADKNGERDQANAAATTQEPEETNARRVPLFPLQAGKQSAGLSHLIVAGTEEEETAWIAEQLMRLLVHSSGALAGKDCLEKKDGLVAKALTERQYRADEVVIAVRSRAFAQNLCSRLQPLLHNRLLLKDTHALGFQYDTRISQLLCMVGQILGIFEEEPDAPSLQCPDKVLVKGPLAIAAFFGDAPPFGNAFWKSAPFLDLAKTYDMCNGWAGLFTLLALHEGTIPALMPLTVVVLTYEEMQDLQPAILFMPGLEDGFVPFAGDSLFSGRASKNSTFNLQAERDLFFTALGRTTDLLLLSCARTRPHTGGVRLKPSRFFNDIPKNLLSTSTLVRQKEVQARQLSLLS